MPQNYMQLSKYLPEFKYSSTYEPTEQFIVKRWTTQQTFSRHFFYTFSETTTQSHLD